MILKALVCSRRGFSVLVVGGEGFGGQTAALSGDHVGEAVTDKPPPGEVGRRQGPVLLSPLDRLDRDRPAAGYGGTIKEKIVGGYVGLW
jgi:hypothetical protein